MATVAELGVDIDATDRASSVIHRVDALIRSLGGDDVDVVVKASTDAAERDLKKVVDAVEKVDRTKAEATVSVAGEQKARAQVASLLSDLDKLTKTTMKIDVDLEGADEIAALQEVLGHLGEDVVVDLDTARALAQIEALRARLAALEDEGVDVDIDTGAAYAALAALEARLILATRDRTIKVDMDRSLLPTLDSIAQSATRAAGQVRGVTAAILTIGPALVPLGAVAIGAVGGLGTSLVAAGVGAGLFGAVAYSAFKPITDVLGKMKDQQDAYNRAVTDKQRDAALEKQKALWESLSPAQRRSAESLGSVVTVWNDLVKAMEPQIFTLAARGMDMVAAAIPSTLPMLRSMGVAFDSTLTSLEKNVASPFWQDFLSKMSSIAGPMTGSLLRSFGNIVTGIAGIMNAFLPMSVDVTAGLEGLTAKFAAWGQQLADSAGFRAFTEYIRTNWPLVREVIVAVGRGLVQLVIAAAPLGEAILQGLIKFSDFIAAIGRAHPGILTTVLAIVGATIAFINLLGPILAVISVLSKMSSLWAIIQVAVAGLASALGVATGPMLLIGLAIAAVVAALVLAYAKIAWFRDLVNALGAQVSAAFQVVKTAVLSAFAEIGSFIDEQRAKWSQWWAANSADVMQAVATITPIITTWLSALALQWQIFWTVFSTVVEAAWEVIKLVVDGALQVIRGIITAAVALINGDWSAFWRGLGDIAMGLITVITAPFVGLWNQIREIFTENGIALRLFWDTLWTGFVSFVTGIWTTIVAFFVSIWAAISSAFQAALTAIGAFLTATWMSMIEITISTWTAIQAFFVGIWTAIQALFTAALTQISVFLTATWTAIQATTAAVWTAIVAFFVGIWTAIQALFTAALTQISVFLIATWTTIQATTTAVWAAIQAFLSSTWVAIQALIQSALSSILASLTAAWGNVVSITQSTWAAVVSAIQAAASSALQAVVQMGNSIISTLTGLAGRAFSAAVSIGQSIVNGIRSMIGAVASAASALAAAITAPLPGSPAKTGPLSGRGYALLRGRRMVADLARGLGDDYPVRTAMGDIADLMALSMAPQTAMRALSDGRNVLGQGGGVTVEAGAVQVSIAEGVDPQAARAAFSDAGEELAALLVDLQRR